jgi:uncharacterized protein YebE (UPF0316 family)
LSALADAPRHLGHQLQRLGDGSEKFLLTAELKSNQQAKFKSLIHELDPTAFVMVNETKYVVGGFDVSKKKSIRPSRCGGFRHAAKAPTLYTHSF